MSGHRSGWSIAATQEEVRRPLPGDDVVPVADVVMDRAFTLSAPPAAVWPWFVQLGKHRAGWYLPLRIERLLPVRRRALRQVSPALQRLGVGDVIPDWGGPGATFEVATFVAPRALVHISRRGATSLSWAIVLQALEGGRTRVQLRLRLAPVRRRQLARWGGGAIDYLTVLGLAAGLRERTTASVPSADTH